MDKRFKSDADADCFASCVITTLDGKRAFGPTPESRMLMMLRSLEEVCGELMKSKKVIFHCKDAKKLTHSPFAERFLAILQQLDAYAVDDHFPECRFNPFLKVILEEIIKIDAGHMARSLRVAESFGKCDVLAVQLNSLVDNVRKELSSKEHKRRFDNYKRGWAKNRRSLYAMVKGIFKVYSKVLVVRLDLSYKKDLSMQLDNQNCSEADVKKHMAILLRDMKTKLFKKNFITYVWKLEYGPMKGYHYHAFFFFDGSKVMKDIGLAEKIGQHWATVATEGSGGYFNCNRIKNRYPHPAIGMVDHWDSIKIDNLLTKAMEYILKVDHYVRPISGDRLRSFGKGATPKKSEVPLGRPRHKEEGPKLPHEIFGLPGRVASKFISTSRQSGLVGAQRGAYAA